MTRPLSARHRSRGLSLIELMVALFIGALLMLGLVQVFAASRAAYATSQGISRVQENARFAMDFLQRDIRMAGHFGCVNDQAHWVGAPPGETPSPALHLGGIDSGSGNALDFSVSIEGYEAPGSGPESALTLGGDWEAVQGISGLSPAPSGGSDIIVLRFFSPLGVPASVTDAGVGFPSDRLGVLTTGGVATPTLFGVANCSQADVFSGTAAAGSVATSAAGTLAVDRGYQDAEATLYRAESIVYYVAPNPAGVRALWRARAGSNGAYAAEELVEGIESLQFLYGQDQRDVLTADTPPVGNITRYGTAAAVRGTLSGGQLANAWRRVGLVQVGVLAASPTPSASPAGARALRVLGTRFASYGDDDGDGRYRASYEATVALRNRLFGN